MSCALVVYDSPTSVSDPAARPRSFSLKQNYPNPFNPSPVKAYWLPELAFLSMRIFTLLAEQIPKLEQPVMRAGTHHITWNTLGRPSRVDLVRVTGGGSVQTRRMLLLG